MDSSTIADMAIGVTKKWTKQRKAEERSSNAANRAYAMMRSYKVTVRDAAYEVMERAYMKASNNGTLPAAARQVMYAARPYILDRTEKDKLDGPYFQQVMKDYMHDHNVDWDVVFDARGNYLEPHTDKKIPLGTLEVRSYINEVEKGSDDEYETPDVIDELYPTIGPKNRFGAVLFIEKEGFMPLLKKVKLAERYDIAIMSTKGMSNIASRNLVDNICADVPLLIVRDFDKAGFSIASTIQSDSKHHYFWNDIKAIDLGLRLEDVEKWGLASEPVTNKGGAKYNLYQNGATDAEVDFLCTSYNSGQRVELNAFASDEFVKWLEKKLEANGIKKVIPDEKTLEEAYRRAYKLAQFQKLIDEHADDIEKEGDEIDIPDDIEKQIQEVFDQDPAVPWDKALNQILESDE